jgi:quinol monooxygenase YgiN
VKSTTLRRGRVSDTDYRRPALPQLPLIVTPFATTGAIGKPILVMLQSRVVARGEGGVEGDMPYARVLLASAVLIAALTASSVFLAATSGAQTTSSAPVDTAFHAVSYVEARATDAKAARTALTQYRDARRTHNGLVRVEFFEQIGRPGHFAGVETWRDQAAFDARDMAAQKQLLAALQPIRVSDYDQRPYKTLTTAPASTSTDRQAVYVVSHVDVTQSPQVPIMLRRLADASRQEPGNLRFDVVQHTMRANHFTVIEGWRNQPALDAHVAAAHTKLYRDEIQPMTGSPLDERVYTPID